MGPVFGKGVKSNTIAKLTTYWISIKFELMQLLYCVEILDITRYKYVDFGGVGVGKWLNG